MWPPLTGYAYELRSAGEPHFSALLQAAQTVCKNLEWTGPASFDFVLDEDGQFRFVDFNPRLWGSAGAVVAARVDLYGGIERWIRSGDAGAASRSVPGHLPPRLPQVHVGSVEHEQMAAADGFARRALGCPVPGGR